MVVSLMLAVGLNLARRHQSSPGAIAAGKMQGHQAPDFTLQSLDGKPVKFVDQCIGGKAEKAAADLKDGEIVLLENLRFHNEEEANDDAFLWRDRLWVTRWGLAELILMGAPLLVVTLLLIMWGLWYAALLPGVVLVWLVSFFRDPKREVPQGAGLVLQPSHFTFMNEATSNALGGLPAKAGITERVSQTANQITFRKAKSLTCPSGILSRPGRGKVSSFTHREKSLPRT